MSSVSNQEIRAGWLHTRYPAKLAIPAFLICTLISMSQDRSESQCDSNTSEIVAAYVAREISLDAAHPSPEWKMTSSVNFCCDWQGKNPDPGRATLVRVLWSPATLYVRFDCHYRELQLFSDAAADGRRDHLWDRDVAEVFLQPDPSRPRYYKEFEVSPNGMWIDLNISPTPRQDLNSGMKRSAWLDEANHIWAAELAIPMKSLTAHFDPAAVWRVNFFRVEGREEPRFYLAWQPTHTPQPNFHVPDAFGHLRFTQPASSRQNSH